MKRCYLPMLPALAFSAAVASVGASPVAAEQGPDITTTLCGQAIPEPAQLPPAGSDPVVYVMGICFDKQHDASSLDAQAYLALVHLKPSRPSRGEWVPYGEDTRTTVKADFRRLWASGFLDDIVIEAQDYVFANGVVGKVITYHLEERERIKIVTYDGSNALDRGKLEDTLKERGIDLKLSSFLDRGAIARASAAARELLSEKGFIDARVSHAVTPVEGAAKLVNVAFTIDDGPRTAIRDVTFTGNREIADGALERALESNRPQGLLTIVTGAGRYQATKYEEDATRVEDYYRDHGYINVKVGQAELHRLDDSPDGRTRYVQLRIPVREGARYKVGTIGVEGNTLVKTEAVRSRLKLDTGDWYRESAVRDAIRKTQEIYGAGGYIEFTAFPDLTPTLPQPGDRSGAPRVDVVLRINEGPQYVVNRINFVGNTTTRDAVIRRELGLYEGSVFNTDMLKYSVKRLNQLGYFKPIDDIEKDVHVDKTKSREHGVDVTLNLEEQNRNSVQFGAGMSQYDGIFGSVQFTTTNFLGRGESVSLMGQKGARSSVYQVAFTEPYVFNRPISTGIDLYSRKYDYLTGVDEVGYSEVRSGLAVSLGRPLFRFSRVFLTYGFERIETSVSKEIEEGLSTTASVGVPLFNYYYDTGLHTESRITPSFLLNTVDNPLMPHSGRRIAASLPIAGGPLGGTVKYIKPELEVVQYIPTSRRTGFGVRAQGGYLRPYGDTDTLPYYLRYFLGGETQIRGVDIRTVGPYDSKYRAVGGDRFVLFNAEYYINLVGPLQAVLFHDAGQAFQESDPLDFTQLRTSSGIEFRMLMPMLNVPFRVIYAWNVYRDTFQPARALKFSVGTTF